MKLTKDQEQAVSAWYARYCIDNGKEPIKLLASNIAVAATERMQDENANLRDVIENLERQCNSSEVLIESARASLDTQYAVDWHSSHHHYTEATKRAKEYRDKLKRKAGIDQREAEGDGDAVVETLA